MRMPQQCRTVLHAEDSDDDAFFFERALAASNIVADLVRVTDGSAAIEYLERAAGESKDLSSTHVLFLDLKMPGMTGFEVLEWIRDRNLAIEVFVLSGSDLTTDVDSALALGAAGYYVKPISPAELGRRLGSREQGVGRR